MYLYYILFIYLFLFQYSMLMIIGDEKEVGKDKKHQKIAIIQK